MDRFVEGEGKMQSIELIALDIDQTLTHQKDVISPRNLAAIRAAQKKGVFVTIATGRGFLSSKKIWSQLEIEGPTIQYGGAMLVHSPDGEPISVAALSPDLVRDALALAHDYGIHVQIFDGDTVIAEKDCPFFTFYHERTNLPYRIDPALREKRYDNVPKVLAYAEPEQALKLQQEFQAALAGRADVTISQPGFIEINGCGVSKAAALEKLAGIMRVPQESVAAIGDSTLDLSMIRWAGCGVCVANGTKNVLDEADIIVPSCQEDGIAYFIENYVL